MANILITDILTVKDGSEDTVVTLYKGDIVDGKVPEEVITQLKKQDRVREVEDIKSNKKRNKGK